MSNASLDVTTLDVEEEKILRFDSSILRLLLMDKSSKKNILWGTKDYEILGDGYLENDEISPDKITGTNTFLIRPRSSKGQKERTERTREKAEVFTPCWVCNKQNNLIDCVWFSRKDVFNKEVGEKWKVTSKKIDFSNAKGNWKDYVNAVRFEVACGEAPYLVSRYDTVTGNKIPVNRRIGLFDRKMRIVEENAQNDEDWLFWSIRALQSIYGYEYQGDNLLLARENILFTYIDYYLYHFHKLPDIPLLRKVANIISWNIWQMDGIKYVIPNSCNSAANTQLSFFGESGELIPCPGCKSKNINAHIGIYCRIHDWRKKESVRFIDLINGGH